MELGTTITGATELDKTFLALPRTTRRKAVMPVLREGGKVIQAKAIANLKAVTTGNSTGVLVRNIRVYNKKKTKGYYGVLVQVRRGLLNKKIKGKSVRVGLYAAVLEYGKKGQPPRSWIRKAIREGVSESLIEMQKEFKSRLTAVVLAAKNGT